MYEDRTIDNILQEMLDSISADLDKSEGSLIYTALAPAALKLADAYADLDNYMDMVFTDTAADEWLDSRVKDFGMTRKAAVYAVRELTATGALTIGTRFGLNDTTYAITGTGTGTGYIYEATCEQAGVIGNSYNGAVEPIDYFGDVTATLGTVLTAGVEEETDDELRDRFYSQVRNPSTSGNVADYKNWAMEVTGVGDCKVKALWNGAGTVKAIIVNSDYGITSGLPATVKSYIDSVRPIGATVTVVNPTSLSIAVSATLTLDGTKTLEEVKTAFSANLTSYFTQLVKQFYLTENTSYSASYAIVGSLLIDTEGVSDYASLTVNSGTSNITITEEQIPTVGTLGLVVA